MKQKSYEIEFVLLGPLQKGPAKIASLLDLNFIFLSLIVIVTYRDYFMHSFYRWLIYKKKTLTPVQVEGCPPFCFVLFLIIILNLKLKFCFLQ